MLGFNYLRFFILWGSFILMCLNFQIKSVKSATIAQTLKNDGNFTLLLAAIKKAGLIDAFSKGTSTLTLFAPDNNAFTKLDASIVETILADNKWSKQVLTNILLYHVLPEEKNSSIVNGESTTLLGANITINVPEINKGAAKITKADLYADGGIIHRIDSVLLPPEKYFTSDLVCDILNLNPEFSSFIKISKALNWTCSDLKKNGQVFTLLVPTNEAFEILLDHSNLTLKEILGNAKLTSLLHQILKLHVIEGAVFEQNNFPQKLISLGGKVNSNEIILSNSTSLVDLIALDGIVHGLDEVIITPKLLKQIMKWHMKLKNK